MTLTTARTEHLVSGSYLNTGHSLRMQRYIPERHDFQASRTSHIAYIAILWFECEIEAHYEVL